MVACLPHDSRFWDWFPPRLSVRRVWKFSLCFRGFVVCVLVSYDGLVPCPVCLPFCAPSPLIQTPGSGWMDWWMDWCLFPKTDGMFMLATISKLMLIASRIFKMSSKFPKFLFGKCCIGVTQYVSYHMEKKVLPKRKDRKKTRKTWFVTYTKHTAVK